MISLLVVLKTKLSKWNNVVNIHCSRVFTLLYTATLAGVIISLPSLAFLKNPIRAIVINGRQNLGLSKAPLRAIFTAVFINLRFFAVKFLTTRLAGTFYRIIPNVLFSSPPRSATSCRAKNMRPNSSGGFKALVAVLARKDFLRRTSLEFKFALKFSLASFRATAVFILLSFAIATKHFTAVCARYLVIFNLALSRAKGGKFAPIYFFIAILAFYRNGRIKFSHSYNGRTTTATGSIVALERLTAINTEVRHSNLPFTNGDPHRSAVLVFRQHPLNLWGPRKIKNPPAGLSRLNTDIIARAGGIS